MEARGIADARTGSVPDLTHKQHGWSNVDNPCQSVSTFVNLLVVVENWQE